MATRGDFEQTVEEGSDAIYDVFCTPCANDNKHSEAENYCVECREYFCVRCIKDHNKFAIMKTHQILDKAGMAALGAKHTSSVPTERCVAHHGNIIDTYCPDHRTVACPTCISIDHRFCGDITYLPIAAKGILKSQKYGEVKHLIQDLQNQLENLKQHQQEELENLEKDKAIALKHIEEYRTSLEQELERMAKKITDALDSKHKTLEDALAEQIGNLEGVLTSLEAKLQSIVTVKDDNETSLFVHVINGQLLVDEGKELIKKIEDAPLRDNLVFEKNEVLELALKTTEQLGDIVGEMNTKPIQKDKSSMDGHTTGVINKVTHQLSTALIGNFNVRTDTETNLCAIEGCCLLNDGILIITDRGNKNVKKLNSVFQVTSTCKMRNEPFGVCATGTKEVAVALSKKNMIQFVQAGYNLQRTHSFKTDGQCCGLAYENNVFFVSYNDKEELHTYDKYGMPLKKLLVNTECFDQNKYVDSFITLSADRLNVLYNNSENGVITMDANGQMVSSFTDKDLKHVTGMCVLENGNILVCEYDANQIFQFTADGRKLGALLQQKGKGCLRKPQAMCVDKDNSLIIVATDNADTIKVFKLD